MAVFEYEAVARDGARSSGVLSGTTEAAIYAELEAKRLTPLRIAERVQRPSLLRRGVAARKLGQSYAQLADLLRAGVPLLRSLELLAGTGSQPRLAAAFRALGDHVRDGGELADGMAQNAGVFPSIHVAMVRAGEKGGFLEQVFQRLAQFVNGQAELRAKILGSLVYPAVLVTVGAGVLAAIFGIFVPMFRPMFAQIERLPAVTVFVFGVSEAVSTYGLLTLALLAGAGVALWRLSRRADVRRKVAEVVTLSPVVGTLVRALAAARFCRLLGTMEANGVPLIPAMQIARDAAGNILMAEAIDEAIEAVRGGDQIAPQLKASGLFGDDVVEMIAVGEAAGNVDEVLLGVADTIESRVDRLLANAVKLIEPALLVVIAATIFVVAVALILPLTRVTASF